ncbi:hypothetical protein NW752_008181 [Fusarium irregulare]|uniref:Uncharacterized protein n=1 Tax=Fusarium irregulare TaxID=2494466 RepID=A0A9W8PW60_9HYPO|nr:hypothetical protein NW752_008181 [Fusarium irregulare]KAJ4019564.1 hypothetical protein NW766_003299 [Fusarium irregulare]
MVKEYFLAPNFTTAPPPEGPIKLGSIIRNINEFEPLNEHDQTIPTTQLSPLDVKNSLDISLDDLHSAHLSLTARALDVLGLGTGTSIQRTKGTNCIISCKHLETQTFNPTSSFIRDSMGDPGVQYYMKSSWFRYPVYMVTGLKVARGASSTSSSSSVVAVEHDTSLLLAGTPASVGMSSGYARNINHMEKWDTSTDFIVAFKVKKVWLDRKDEVNYKGYNKRAVMRDGKPSEGEVTITVWSDDHLTPDEVHEMLEMRDVTFEGGQKDL